MIYFTSDQHFGHENIIRHCNRPFENAEEMDKVLTDNWNSVVKAKDEVYILGDFTMRPAAQAHEYLSRLNGRKYFIRGNHDKFLKNYAQYEDDFEWIKDYYRLIYNGIRIVMFHYPILEWDQFYRDSIHLYGHVHNSELSAKRMWVLQGSLAFNVGVDENDFFPVSIEDILKRAQGMKNVN